MDRLNRRAFLLGASALAATRAIPVVAAGGDRWSAQQAADWYRQQPWLVGSNYIPATRDQPARDVAGGHLRPAAIDRELGWAEGLGMNTMRVFLHDLLWEQDADGFRQRIDTVPRHRRPAPHPADVRALRLVLGPVPAARAAARADAGRPQLRLGAEPRRRGLRTPPSTPRLRGLRAGRRRRLRPTTSASSAGTSGTSPTTPTAAATARWSRRTRSSSSLALLPQVFAWARAASPRSR